MHTHTYLQTHTQACRHTHAHIYTHAILSVSTCPYSPLSLSAALPPLRYAPMHYAVGHYSTCVVNAALQKTVAVAMAIGSKKNMHTIATLTVRGAGHLAQGEGEGHRPNSSPSQWSYTSGVFTEDLHCRTTEMTFGLPTQMIAYHSPSKAVTASNAVCE